LANHHAVSSPRSGVIYVAHSVSCGNVISSYPAAERRHLERVR